MATLGLKKGTTVKAGASAKAPVKKITSVGAGTTTSKQTTTSKTSFGGGKLGGAGASGSWSAPTTTKITPVTTKKTNTTKPVTSNSSQLAADNAFFGGSGVVKSAPKKTTNTVAPASTVPMMSTVNGPQEGYIQRSTEAPMTPIPNSMKMSVAPTNSTTPVAGTAGGSTNAIFSNIGSKQSSSSEPSYSDDSDKRLKEIQVNLKNYEKTAPQLFEDREAFNRAFSYDKRSDAQKAILDSYIGSYQQRNAQANMIPVEPDYSYLNNIDYLTKNGISSEEKSWLTQNNPALLDEYNTYVKEQATLNNINLEVGTDTNIMEMVQNMFGQVDTPNLLAEQKRLMSEYGVEDLQKEYNQNKAKVLEIQSLMSNKLSDVRKRYEGTGATEGFIRAMAAKENAYLQQELDDAQVAYGLSGDNLNDALSNVNNTLELEQAQYGMDRQAMNDKMAQAGFMMDLMSYETPAQKDERERNNRLKQQEYTEGNINSTDPAIRRRAVTNAVDWVLKEFDGIPMVRSRDQMVADIQQLVDKGMDLGTAITQNIRNPIMKKDEYKLWAAKKLGITDYTSLGGYNVNFNEDGTMRLTQNSSYTGGYTPDYTPVSQSKLESAFKQVVYQGDGSQGGQCGSFVNDYLQDMGIGRLFTDPIDKKKAVANTNTPTVGSVAIMDSSVAPEYGHVGIVTSVNSDGTVTIKNSNRGGDQKVSTNKVKQSSIYGYFDPRIGGASSMQSSATETPYDLLYKTYLEDGKTIPSEKELKSMGMTYNQFVRNAYDYGKRAVTSSANPLVELAVKGVSLANFTSDVSRKAAIEDITKIAETGDINAVQTKLKNIYKQNLGAVEMQAFTTNENTITALLGIKEELKDIPTSYLKGGIEKTAQKLGSSTDPKLAKLGIKMNNALDILRRGRSGAALTEFEEAFYNAMFPTINKNFEFNNAAIEGLTESLQQNIDSRLWTFYGDDVYNNIWGQQEQEVAQQSTPQYSFTVQPVTTTPVSNGYYTFTLSNGQTVQR